MLIDTMVINNGLKNSLVMDFSDEEVLLNNIKDDKPLLMLGGHVGSWQVAKPFLKRIKHKKINIAMRLR